MYIASSSAVCDKAIHAGVGFGSGTKTIMQLTSLVLVLGKSPLFFCACHHDVIFTGNMRCNMAVLIFPQEYGWLPTPLLRKMPLFQRTWLQDKIRDSRAHAQKMYTWYFIQLYEVNRENEKLSVARNWTQGFWLELPVLCQWATTTSQCILHTSQASHVFVLRFAFSIIHRSGRAEHKLKNKTGEAWERGYPMAKLYSKPLPWIHLGYDITMILISSY